MIWALVTLGAGCTLTCLGTYFFYSRNSGIPVFIFIALPSIISIIAGILLLQSVRPIEAHRIMLDFSGQRNSNTKLYGDVAPNQNEIAVSDITAQGKIEQRAIEARLNAENKQDQLT